MFALGNKKFHGTYVAMRRQRCSERLAQTLGGLQLRAQNRMKRTSSTRAKWRRKKRMLDLSMQTTEECVYPKCEGGYDMCCDTTECGAQNEICRLRFRALVPARHAVIVTSHGWDSHRFGVM